MTKPLNYKDPKALMNLEEATAYLKKLGEWESVWRMDRDIILKWAEFLKKKENEKIPKKTTEKKLQKNTEH